MTGVFTGVLTRGRACTSEAGINEAVVIKAVNPTSVVKVVNTTNVDFY
jgi:hypothetical protein